VEEKVIQNVDHPNKVLILNIYCK